MTSTQTPAFEISDSLIEMFRADPQFVAATVGGFGGLLFPTWSLARLEPRDWRVWSNHANMPPDNPALLQVLPRLLFDVNWRTHEFEQEQAGTLHGPVKVWLHVVTPRDQEPYGDRLVAAAMLRIISTPLTGARIIAGELTPVSDVAKSQIASFGNAWEWLVEFRSPNVGVLA